MINIKIEQTKSLREFAREILHLLNDIDGFSRLKENNILVNYGSPIGVVNESDIGFLLETTYKNNGVTYLMTPISLEGLFYWCDNPDWKRNLENRDQSDVFLIDGLPYLFSLNEWSEIAECYPDGTLIHPVLKDLSLLIELYYPQYSIEKINTIYVLTSKM